MFCILLLLIVGVPFFGVGPLGSEANVCTQTDIVIVLDASNSVSPEAYEHATHFAAHVASYFMAPDRVALISYSDEIHIRFGLNNNFSPQKLYLEITRHHPADKGNTATGPALFMAIQELELNARPNTAQKIVVFTDGESMAPGGSSSHMMGEMIAKAKGKNIITFSIGIGRHHTSQARKDELITIAAGLPENAMTIDDDFEHLITRLRQVLLLNGQYMVCKHSVEDIPENCYSDNDLVIVLDSSGSVTWPNYIKATAFVSRLARAFVAPNRIGFITYSKTVTPRIRIDSNLSPEQIQDVIATHPYDQGSTFTGGAIEQAMHECERNKRPGIAMKIVVLTDGASTEPWPTFPFGWNGGPQYTIKAAAAVKAKHIVMLSVGIGPDTRNADMQTELLTIAHGDSNNRFTVDTFDLLLKRIRELSKRICDVPPPPEISTQGPITTQATTTTTTPTTTTAQTTTTERAMLALGGYNSF